ncbi:MAG: Na(+)-translocating NADH-quinone reductase subunit A [Bdellovibrionales bacterium]|nr:Na(+)-translocating NADH-quinone reductase subunit A [Bdellovibrionales bacterium]
MIKIKRGLDLPISGAPKQEIEKKLEIAHVAVVGPDYVGMKPSMKVKVGDQVEIGSHLFSCKKVDGVRFPSPAAGKVIEINRGHRRAFQSVVIAVDQESETHHKFASHQGKEAAAMSREEVVALMVESGLWSTLRTRPYSKSPALDSIPNSIFITATDTNPLAPNPQVVIERLPDEFKAGLDAISKLTKGNTYLCCGDSVPTKLPSQITVKQFSGAHPAGNVGTHIHFVDPVNTNKSVWHIGYQDLIALGYLVTTGKLWTSRVIALAGPQVKNPRLLLTRVGASTEELIKDELVSHEGRIISGSILSGRRAIGALGYLGPFHHQLTVVEEGDHREFMGWLSPGINKFSVCPTFLSKLIPGKLFAFNTSTNGSVRAIVPTGRFERVMPLDILPTPLLMALSSNDTDQAQALGCLELDEEDLALCTFVCSGKNDYGPLLRENLTTIEREG